MKIYQSIVILAFGVISGVVNAQQAPNIIQVGYNEIMFPEWGNNAYKFLNIGFERKITKSISLNFIYGHFTANIDQNLISPTDPTTFSREYSFVDLGINTIILKSENEKHYLKMITAETFANVGTNTSYDTYYSGNPMHSFAENGISGSMWGIKMGLAYYFYPIKNIVLSPQFCIRWYDEDEPSLDLNISVEVAF